MYVDVVPVLLNVFTAVSIGTTKLDKSSSVIAVHPSNILLMSYVVLLAMMKLLKSSCDIAVQLKNIFFKSSCVPNVKFDGFISKPVNISKMMRLIDQYMK